MVADAGAPGCSRADTIRIPRKNKNSGLMILPIQSVIFPGRREKSSTRAKNTAEKRNSVIRSETAFPSIGAMPVVKDVVAHRGMAKHGPMVK